MDIGCGTGGLTLALSSLGYDIFGVDSSQIMLNAAYEKARKHRMQLRYVLGYAEKLYSHFPLDFAVAALDVYNYVPDLNKAFKSAAAVLKNGGVLAFDISSEYKLRNILDGNTFSETKDDITYIWQNFLDGKKLVIDFTVFSPVDTSYIKTCETQIQYIRTVEEVKNALTEAGFESIQCYEFGALQPPNEKSERIAFVARKSG